MDLQTYQDRFRSLIELEQEEEMRRHEQEMKNLTGEERQDRGRCLLDMRAVSSTSGFSEEVRVRYERADGSPLGEHEFGTGNLVQVSKNKPLQENNPTATVWSCDRRSVTLSFRNDPPGWATSGRLRLDLYVDNVTYQRMLDALFLLPGLTHEQEPLLDILLGSAPEESSDSPSPEPLNPELNQAQREAVRRARDADNLFLIHGPPGTGKTVTLSELIAQSVQEGESVLATAASNVAVDNLTEYLLEYDLNVVRVGHPARTTPRLREHTLDAQLEDNPTYQKSEEYRREALDLIGEKRELTTPSPRWRRGMSDGEILARADEGNGARGVSQQRLREMARYIEIDDRIDDFFQRSDELEDEAIQELLREADVVCTTNSTAGTDLLAGLRFDLLTIDEATQATEPSCLIPITKTNKLVMAGDHRQLPPTVLSEEAASRGLDRSLFERMADEWGDRIIEPLNVQYRMHQDIMNFPSREFYDHPLKAHHSVANHSLADLPGVNHRESRDPLIRALRPRPVFSWIDTSGLDSPDVQRQGSTSRINPVEQDLLATLWERVKQTGLSPVRAGIITPYKDQARDLRRRLDEPELEIKTVDGFQGREKDLIIISFVRSNPEGEIGFLYEPRRLNVSLTRARRKLVLVGDRDTLSETDVYRRLGDYVSEHGEIIELDSMETLREGALR